MVKLGLGVVIGVVLTALLLQFDVRRNRSVSARPAEQQVPGAISLAPSAVEATDDSVHRAALSAASVEARDGSGEKAAASRAVKLRQMIETARHSIGEYESELRRIEIDNWRSTEPIISPVVLPPEFDWLNETEYKTEYDIIQREPIDPSWASTAEAKIRSYFSSRPELSNQYGWPTVVHCGSTRCLAAFVVYSVDGSPDPMGRIGWEFSSRTADFFELRSSSQFNSDCKSGCVTTRKRSGVTTILWTLIRRE